MKRCLCLLLLAILVGLTANPIQAEIKEDYDEFSGQRSIASQSGPIGDFDGLEYSKLTGDGQLGIDMIYCLDVSSDNEFFSTGYLKVDNTVFTLQSNLGSAFDLKVSNRYFLTDRQNRIISRASSIILRVGDYTERLPDDIVAEWRKVASYQFPKM